MFRQYNQTEPFLFPPVLEELIALEHPAHMINDLVEKLDLTVLTNRYGDMGQPAYLPKLMLKIILYGFSVGVFSSRKLARACQENLAFKYLAGMETPDGSNRGMGNRHEDAEMWVIERFCEGARIGGYG